MYEKHFGFKIKPFALTPDPSFLYRSRQHAMAMTLLEYGLESQAAFSLLTGDVGSGKTTLVRHLLRGLGDRVAVGLDRLVPADLQHRGREHARVA